MAHPFSHQKLLWLSTFDAPLRVCGELLASTEATFTSFFFTIMADAKNTATAHRDDKPWIAEPSGDGFYRVVNALSVVLAQKCVMEDAQLFAAAPDLVEALEELLDVFLDGRWSEFDDKEAEAYRMADAALAKTRGE